MYRKILMFIILASGVYSSCPEQWRFDEVSNVCLHHVETLLTWTRARRFCQKVKGDLVQIWTMDKQTFITTNLSETVMAPSWIGVSDLDKDGVHEYINGSKVVNDRFWDLPPTPSQEQTCAALSPTENVWKWTTCTELLGFFCEIELEPDNTTLDVACSSESCVCNPDSWVYFAVEKKYFIVNRIAKNFSDSTKLCKRLSGQLLMVPSIMAGFFFKSQTALWTTKNSLYWIGLSLGPNNKWTWSDGTTLSGRPNWNETPTNKLRCAAVIWDYSSKWRGTYCSSENFHICEAKVPCDPTPGIIINNKTLLWESSSVMIVNDQLVCFKCLVAGGSPDNVTMVKLECHGAEPKIAFGKKWVQLNMEVKVGMNQKKCKCEITKVDGTKKVSDVLVDFRQTPYLPHEQDDGQIFIIPGSEKVLTFNVTAIPKPTIFAVLKESKLVDSYTVIVANGTNPYEYVASVFITGYSYKDLGQYVLILGNGHGRNLEVNFRLDVPAFSFPMLIFNGKETEKDATVEVINTQNVTISCELTGYQQRVTNVLVSCDHHENVSIGERTAEGVFKIDAIMKGQHCRCESVQNNGKKELAQIEINFKSSPLLVDFDESRSLSFTIEDGKKGVLNFTIFAIPEPEKYLLIETSSGELNPFEFIITMEPSRRPYHYIASILIKRFTLREANEYNLIVENSVGEKLNIVFTIKMKEESVFHVTFGSVVIILMLVILSVLLVVAICYKEKDDGSSNKNKKSKNQRSIDSSYQETSSSSSDTDDDAGTENTEYTEYSSSEDDDDSGNQSGTSSQKHAKKTILPALADRFFGLLTKKKQKATMKKTIIAAMTPKRMKTGVQKAHKSRGEDVAGPANDLTSNVEVPVKEVSNTGVAEKQSTPFGSLKLETPPVIDEDIVSCLESTALADTEEEHEV